MENKIATLKTIAKQLNFSISTVSRALHNDPSIGLRTTMQVQKLAKELNYEPNQTALFFKQQKTHIIGVILPNLEEDFFSKAVSGIEDIAKVHNYSLLIGQSHDSFEHEKEIANSMKNHRVDGLIVSLSKLTNSYSHLTELEKYNIPVVFFDRVPEINNVNKVSSDIYTTTAKAVEFLIKNGHRRIGVINGPPEMKSCKERTRAIIDILEKKRLKVDPALLVSTDLTREKTYDSMRVLLSLKRPPTAVIAINDYVALDAIRFAKESNYKINKGICFVSYANLPITGYLEYPPIASVEQYPYEQSKKAAEILFELLENKKENKGNLSEESYQNIVIKGQLIIHQK